MSNDCNRKTGQTEETTKGGKDSRKEERRQKQDSRADEMPTCHRWHGLAENKMNAERNRMTGQMRGQTIKEKQRK